MPGPQLTTDEIARLLNEQALLKTPAPLEGEDPLAAGAAANLGPLGQVPVPPQADMGPPPPPPDPNDPHNQYMAGADQPPPAAAPLAPRKEAEAPKPPPTAAPPPPAAAPTPPTKDEVVSTKPGWYEAIAPPPTSPIPGVVGGLGLGVLGALLARKSPGVAAGMAGLGGLSALQAVADAPQREFDNRTNAAKTQADMHAKLAGHGDSAAELARLELAQKKFAFSQETAEEKARIAEARGKLGTPETTAVQDMFIEQGMDQAKARRLTGTQLLTGRTGFQQELGQERGQTNAVTNHNMRTDTQVELKDLDNAEWRARQGVEQGSQIAKEDREQVKLDEQSEIDGFQYTGKRAPNIAAVEKARGIADQSGVAEMSASNMVELWKQLNTESKLAPGWAEGALSDQQRSLVNELRAWALNLDTAQRQLALMGVPQQFEMEIIRNVSPDATGIRALLNNGQAWAAQGRVLGQLVQQRMKNYGYSRMGAPTAPQAPSSGDAPLKDKLAEAGQATQGLTQEVAGAAGQVVQNGVNTAKQVGGAVAGAVAGPLKKIKFKNAQTGQWMDAQKTAQEIQATIEALKKKGLDPSQYIQVAP